MKTQNKPLDPARGCANGILISLAFWIVLALLVFLALHFWPIWRLP